MRCIKTAIIQGLKWTGLNFNKVEEGRGMRKLQILAAVLFMIASAASYAAENGGWESDFDRICGVTDMATTLSVNELRDLIADCDRLLETLSKVNHPKKKLYIFRLKKCRNLFAFVLDTKVAKEN